MLTGEEQSTGQVIIGINEVEELGLTSALWSALPLSSPRPEVHTLVVYRGDIVKLKVGFTDEVREDAACL